jgi:hypothetical protein
MILRILVDVGQIMGSIQIYQSLLFQIGFSAFIKRTHSHFMGCVTER